MVFFFCFFLFLGRVYKRHAKEACEPATGVSDMIPETLRSKSMVRSQELTDEGAPTCKVSMEMRFQVREQ